MIRWRCFNITACYFFFFNNVSNEKWYFSTVSKGRWRQNMIILKYGNNSKVFFRWISGGPITIFKSINLWFSPFSSFFHSYHLQNYHDSVQSFNSSFMKYKNKMQNKKYYTVRTFPKFNRKIVERSKINTPNTHIHDSWLVWFGKGISK
jgi:hypothetical protein